ncbi:hypothetical protein HDU81_004321 [Chytriomyces hyalinus]|nr:hypothetical protein HDU81_004321 [Chytriomyces hyalinus]
MHRSVAVILFGTNDPASPLYIFNRDTDALRLIIQEIYRQLATNVRYIDPAKKLKIKSFDVWECLNEVTFSRAEFIGQTIESGVFVLPKVRGVFPPAIIDVYGARVSLKVDNLPIMLVDPYQFNPVQISNLLPDDLKRYAWMLSYCLERIPKHYGTLGYLSVHESYVKAGSTQDTPGLFISKTRSGCVGIDTTSPAHGYYECYCRRRFPEDGIDEYGYMRMQGGRFIASNTTDSKRVYDCLITNSDTVTDTYQPGEISYLRKEINKTQSAVSLSEETIAWITPNTPYECVPQNATDSVTGSIVISGGVGVSKNVYLAQTLNVTGSSNLSGNVSISNTIDSTSTSTGSLTVAGGLGLSKSLTVGTTIKVTGTLDATSVTSAAAIVSGGLSVAKSVYIGSNVIVNSTVDSTSTSTGSFKLAGGAGIVGSVYIGRNLNVNGTVTVNTPVDSTDAVNKGYTDSGSYLSAGSCISISGTTISVTTTSITSVGTLTGLTVSGQTSIINTAASTSSVTGALKVAGGLGVVGNINTGGNLAVSGTSSFSGAVTVPTPVNGTDAVTKTYTDGLSYLTAGTGLTRTGATISLNASQSGITSVGTLTGLAVSGTAVFNNTTDSSSSITGALVIGGGLGIGKNMYVSGNSTFTGTVTVPSTVNSTDAAQKSYVDELSYLTAGTGLTLSTGTLSVNSSQITSLGTLTGLTSSGAIAITSTTASTSSVTGALTVAGGVGIQGAVKIGGAVGITGGLTVTGTVTVPSTVNNTDAAQKAYVDALSYLSAGTGLTLTTGTLAVNSSQSGITTIGTLTDLTVSGATSITVTTDSSSSITGALTVSGGVGIAKSVSIGTNLSVTGTTGLTGVVSVLGTTVSSSSTTGALTVAGGVGIGGTLKVGGGVGVTGTLYVTGTVTVPTSVNATDAAQKGYVDALSYLTAGTGLSLSSGTLSVNSSQSGIVSLGTLTGLTSSGVVSITNTTASASSVTGALTVAGGAGIAGNTNIAGNVSVTGTSTFTGTVTVPNPVNSTDAVTKAYCDAAIQGLSIRDSVVAATTTNGTLATSFANGSVIDGVTLVTGYRILIKNQTVGSQNGIYRVNASGAPTLVSDLPAGSDASGIFTFVEIGTINSATGWVVTNLSGSAIVGTSNITFTQFSGSGQMAAGTGLTLTGNVFSVNSAQPTVTSVGTLTGLTSVGDISVTSTTSSSSKTTGAVTIAGGAGVSGNVSIGSKACFYGTSNYTALQAPSAASGITLTLPSSLPSTAGYALVSDLSGNLSFGAVNGNATDSRFTNYSFSGANNQSAAANVTGLSYTGGSFDVNVSVAIVATTNLTQLYRLSGVLSSGNSLWNLTAVQVSGDASGVTFSITSGGQIQYTSASYPGFVSLTMNWSAYISNVQTLPGAFSIYTNTYSLATATVAPITFTTPSFTQGSLGLTLASNAFTNNTGGPAVFAFHISVHPGTYGTLDVWLNVNGSASTNTNRNPYHVSVTSSFTTTSFMVTFINSTDYVTPCIYQTSGSTQTVGYTINILRVA